MVKDENDIVREWIIYHGELFGYENICSNFCLKCNKCALSINVETVLLAGAMGTICVRARRFVPYSRCRARLPSCSPTAQVLLCLNRLILCSDWTVCLRTWIVVIVMIHQSCLRKHVHLRCTPWGAPISKWAARVTVVMVTVELPPSVMAFQSNRFAVTYVGYEAECQRPL